MGLKPQTKTSGSSSSSEWSPSSTSSASFLSTPKSTNTEKKLDHFTTKLHGWPSFSGPFTQSFGSLLKVNEWSPPPWKLACTCLWTSLPSASSVLSSSKPVVHLKPSTTATRTSMLKLPSTQNPPHKRSVFLHPRKKDNLQKDNLQSERSIQSLVWVSFSYLESSSRPILLRSFHGARFYTPNKSMLLQESNFSKLLNFTFFQLHHNALLPFLVSS